MQKVNNFQPTENQLAKIKIEDIDQEISQIDETRA
jgi:hypothetical protein